MIYHIVYMMFQYSLVIMLFLRASDARLSRRTASEARDGIYVDYHYYYYYYHIMIIIIMIIIL